jgi:hypothetical protein
VPATKTARTRSARSRGLRTLQHQTLPAATRHAIDTEVWFRALLLEEQAVARGPRWATKDQVHDEALEWFLEQHAAHPAPAYPRRREGDEDLTFWLDSRLMQRARRMAARDGVKVARLIDAAFTSYVQRRVRAGLVRFRERVQRQARKLYRGEREGTSKGRKTRP